MRFRAFALLVLLAGPMAAPAIAEVPKSQRILFVGNDLTESGDIPARVAKLAAALGRSARGESVFSSNFTLEDHWREGRAQAEIAKGWDVVILQQGGSAREPDRSSLREYA